jgi:hypothetical protein
MDETARAVYLDNLDEDDLAAQFADLRLRTLYPAFYFWLWCGFV